MSNIQGQWTEIELPENRHELSKTGAKGQSEGDHYIYPLGDDDNMFDENTPTGVFMLLSIALGAVVIAAFCGIVRVIWKLFSCENN